MMDQSYQKIIAKLPQATHNKPAPQFSGAPPQGAIEAGYRKSNQTITGRDKKPIKEVNKQPKFLTHLKQQFLPKPPMKAKYQIQPD